MGYEIRLANGNSTNEGRVEVKGSKIIRLMQGLKFIWIFSVLGIGFKTCIWIFQFYNRYSKFYGFNIGIWTFSVSVLTGYFIFLVVFNIDFETGISVFDLTFLCIGCIY